MGHIEKISIIDKNKLNGEFYFQSLLEEAYNHAQINEADIERIQLMCLELLAHKTQRYTGGDSSSVRVEVAENIMASNLYTIGLYLKSFPCPDDAVKILKETNISELYALGRKQIKIKLETAKHFHAVVMESLVETQNYTYSETIVDGINGFFKIYNPDYCAHEIHITADYPLCNPIENLVGIEFIRKYLESIYYENVFCKYFSKDSIHDMLCGYDEHYQDLIFNLFEQVLTIAIGCSLAETKVADLNITNIQLERLRSILSDKPRGEIDADIRNAYLRMIKEMDLTDIHVQKYIKKALPTLVANIYNAAKINRLQRVFYEPKGFDKNLPIYFSFGEKMDDEEYRFVIGEIIDCRFVHDKIAIIKEKIHSLVDLEDLLFDAKLKADEIMVVFNLLELLEISALAKRHPYKSEMEAVDLSESERTLRLCLHQHILSLPKERQLDIVKTISLLELDNE